MKGKIIQVIIICAVILATVLAFYLKKPPTPSVEQKESEIPSEQIPVIEKQKKEFQATFTLPIDVNKPSHFGIIGEGRGVDFDEDPVNSTILEKLFAQLKQRNVNTIFFTGNLVSGVKRGEDDLSEPIDNQALENDLEKFSKLYNTAFEQKVPFFPALGDREILISKSARSFIDKFDLLGAKIIGEELLYTVSAGHAFFAVIATDELMDGRKETEENFSSSMLSWLDKALKEGARTHKYLFVVGYEPAFPSTTTFSKSHLPERDAFWKILINNKVLAYFSSKEHLFDRSNRAGVWQIISGGGGAPFSQGGGSKPFYHSLILTIPGDKEVKEKGKPKMPGIQVIDIEGNMIEEFIMSPDSHPLYQMRIS